MEQQQINEDFEEDFENYTQDLNDLKDKNYSIEMQCFKKYEVLENIKKQNNVDQK